MKGDTETNINRYYQQDRYYDHTATVYISYFQ